jgi:60 kDa SS-A/Ro ribonucleoprotein
MSQKKLISLKDVLFLCHAKPKNKEQAKDWKDLINGTLESPDTWETRLSAGEDKKESFQELLESSKMGKLAIVRNLRNMHDSGVPKALVERELMRNGRPILPFQFLAAAKACPQWEDMVDKAMIKACEGKKKLEGISVVLVDVSGSMNNKISSKSDMTNMDAACVLAILLREICEEVEVFTFSNQLALVPSRHGMALLDGIISSQPHSSTFLGQSLRALISHRKPGIKIERIIVITDEQTHDIPPRMGINKCYIINTATNENGIKNNGEWLTINGFSEYVVDYITEIENETESDEPVIQESCDERMCGQEPKEGSEYFNKKYSRCSEWKGV